MQLGGHHQLRQLGAIEPQGAPDALGQRRDATAVRAQVRPGRGQQRGGPFQNSGGQLFSQLTLTDVRSFPTGPFTRGVLRPQYAFAATGQVDEVASGGSNLFAFREARAGTHGELVLSQLGSVSSFPLASGAASYGHPAIAATNPQFVLLDVRPVVDGTLGAGDIAFRPATVQTFVGGAPTKLPALVDSTADESQPAFTSDGRYVAFVRHGSDGHDRLFVFDSQTQILLNSAGVDLGAVTTRDRGGAVSLYQRPLFTLTIINVTGLLTANLLQSSGVGIFVQRIVGTHKLLGRKAYKLKTVGRVPLGKFHRGTLRRRWDLKVHGHRLAPGRYLVTLRGVKGTIVRELGRPRVLRIR
jgi:hypothetical protein